MKLLNIILILIFCLATPIYADPLVITHKGETITLNSPIIDELCSDRNFRRLVENGYSALTLEKDWKKCVVIVTKLSVMIIGKLRGE